MVRDKLCQYILQFKRSVGHLENIKIIRAPSCPHSAIYVPDIVCLFSLQFPCVSASLAVPSRSHRGERQILLPGMTLSEDCLIIYRSNHHSHHNVTIHCHSVSTTLPPQITPGLWVGRIGSE